MSSERELKGIYVRRCKCGDRPYYDRTPPNRGHWIACNCGREGKYSASKEESIKNWNNNLMSPYSKVKL